LGDADAAVRREAARALGRLRAKRSSPALEKTLDDRDINVRLHAAHALGEIRSPTSATALLGALGDAEYCVREEAAWALREIDDPAVLPALAASLADSEADVDHIVWIFRHHAKPARSAAALFVLLKRPEVIARRRAVRALSRLQSGSDAAVDPLLHALSDTDLTVRRAAVMALRTVREERVLEALRALATREADAELRKSLDEAVAELSKDHRLAAHWSFDDRDTSVARDVSGNGVDGRIVGCRSVAGKIGHALRFANGKYIELGTPEGLRITGRPMTVMAWAKSDADNGVVVARGGALCGYSLYLLDGVARFGIRRCDAPPPVAAGTRRVVGAWVHLVGVIDRDHIELYVDGKLAARTATEGYLTSECGQGMEIGFDVGNSPAETCASFQGVIDEVKVYSVALSAEEIAAAAAEEE